MDDFLPTVLDQPNSNLNKSKNIKDWASTIAVIVLAPLLAIFLTTFVFQTYEVEGPSMEQTLHNQDRLIVLKSPKSWSRLTGNDYIPGRYEIIVFNLDSGFAGSSEKQLIKRVIGLPGERVVIKDGTVKVFNKEHPQGFFVDENSPEAGPVSTTPGNVDQVIEPGTVFVLGDNRDNSYDSPDFGAVPASDIVGKLVLRIYPFEKFDKF